MKFDKFMNFCFKGLCLCLACFILAGFCVSCFHSPVTAHADAVDPIFMAQQADNYKQQLEQQFLAIENAVLTDIRNGNIDQTSALGQQYLKAMAIQAVCLYSPTFKAVFHSADLVLQGLPDDLFDNPSTLDISTGGGVGFYRTSDAGELFTGFVFPCKAGEVICSSEHFSLVIDFNDNTMNANTVPYFTASSAGFQYKGSTIYHQVRYTDSMGYLSNIGQSYNVFYNNTYVISVNSSIPVIRSGTRADYVYLGQGVYVELPASEIDSDRPYDYYNNVVLPYIREELPDVPDSIIVFPYGYQVQEPTEPPTIPNGGIYIDKQFNIGINIITPTDSNGQTVTDASGETVTETVYVTETYPPDGDYRFQLPTLDTLTMYQATVPNPDISSFTGGFAFIWNCVDHFFNDTGFMPVVIACLSMSVLAYVLWKVGG